MSTTTDDATSTATAPEAQPVIKSSRLKVAKKALPWTIAGIMTVGFLGMSSTNVATGTTAAPPQPAATVTQTLPAQTITVAPDACTLALTHAEDLMGLARQALTISGEMITAASQFNTAKLTAGTAKIKALTPQTSEMVATYSAAAAQCRDAA